MQKYSKSSDNAFILNDNTVCKVIEPSTQSQLAVKCEVYTHTESSFKEPIDSKELGIQRASTRTGQIKMIEKTKLTRQAISIPIGSNDIDYMEVLHIN